ncbi:MAG: hypothetical protein HEQ35_20490 [Gloeotrichia echinulata IR180]
MSVAKVKIRLQFKVVVGAIGGIISPTSANQPSLFSKELLENAIKRNSPLSDDINTSQDTNTTQKL